MSGGINTAESGNAAEVAWARGMEAKPDVGHSRAKDLDAIGGTAVYVRVDGF